MATSIRNHTGPVYLCGTCGQPSFVGEHGDQHFDEQWDGVFCPWFPLAGKRLVVQWDGMSLDAVRAQYPDARARAATRSRRQPS
ncbi:hypothetical protein [Streptomyces sp. NPDC060022]|uniref:hypothetical protein n=1 Tax=Streptomyces sp. NPDC060022 TaxID=3347039 RepID=UPI003689D8D7